MEEGLYITNKCIIYCSPSFSTFAAFFFSLDTPKPFSAFFFIIWPLYHCIVRTHGDNRKTMEQYSASNHDIDENSILRVWDIDDSNSTRYDRLRAAPSDDDLRIMWTSISAVLFLVGVLTFVVLLGILTAPRKVRNNTFNTFLFFLVIPDFIFSACCCLTCFMNAVRGQYFSHLMCRFQHFYLVFGIGANAWLNALVALQLYRLLRKSRFPIYKKQYKIPTPRDATRQSLLVYLFVSALACFFYIPNENDALAIISHKGMFCMAGEVNLTSSFLFWGFVFPLVVLIPLVIVVWTYFQVHRYQMLPKTGRRRTLTLFFTQLILIFIVMWVPGLSFVFIGGGYGSPWITWIGVIWSHLQGAAASACALFKPDINKAVLDLMLCRRREEPKETYRVAVQSVSGILEGKEEQHKPLDRMSWNDQHILADPEQPLSETRNNISHEVSNYEGDPSAHWPSQRPVRVNPRLMKWEKEKGETLNSHQQMETAKSPRPKLHSNRSVARDLLRALDNADEEMGESRNKEDSRGASTCSGTSSESADR